MWEVLETTENVVSKSRHVQIDKKSLARFSRILFEKDINPPSWNHHYHYCEKVEKTVHYLLVLDSLNFCFWPAPGKEKWKIRYKPGWLSGYFAMALALKRAIESGIPITSANYLAGLSLDSLKRILGGKGDLQLLEERVQILNELGQLLLDNYDGKAHKLVESAGNSALELVRILAEKLPSFRDISIYEDQKVFFYKRAQILAGDLYGTFSGKGWGDFTDICELTAFADYKLPQILNHQGILQYDQALEQKIDQKINIESGSREEVEIRAGTIHAVELIRDELKENGKKLKAFEIDWILWDLSQSPSFNTRPYHRTKTIFY